MVNVIRSAARRKCDLITLSSLTLLDEPEACFAFGGILERRWC
jgi:hypothetical protein